MLDVVFRSIIISFVMISAFPFHIIPITSCTAGTSNSFPSSYIASWNSMLLTIVEIALSICAFSLVSIISFLSYNSKPSLYSLVFLLATSITLNSSESSLCGSSIAVWKYLPSSIGLVNSFSSLKFLGSLSNVIISELDRNCLPNSP